MTAADRTGLLEDRPAERQTLLERDEGLAAIEALLARVGAGQGGVLLFEGPPGIGKTSLLGHARERARAAGLEVLAAQASELDRGFALGLVRDLFERRLRGLDRDRRAVVEAGPARLAAELLGEASPGAPVDPLAVRHALYWLAVNLASPAPILICVDDAQWADPRSLEWLLYLSRRLSGAPIGLAIATRDAEPGADLSPLRALGDQAGATVIRPAVLGLAATTSVLGAELDSEVDAELAAASRQVTAGNPLLVKELASLLGGGEIEASAAAVRALAGRAPGTLAEMTLARAARLPGPARAVLAAVAVLGSGCGRTEIAGLAEVGPAEAGDLIRRLARLDILAGRDDRVEFVHPLLAGAFYERISAVEKAGLHLRAARALLATGAPAEAVAAHLLHVDPAGEPDFVPPLRRAAAIAVRRGDPRAATHHLRRAIAELPSGPQADEIRLELGRALLACGEPQGAELVEAAIERAGDDRERARLALELGAGLSAMNRYGEACRVLVGAAEGLDGSDRELELALEASIYYAARTLTPSDPDLVRRLGRFPEDLRGESPGERAILVQLATDALLRGAPAARVAEMARRALTSIPAGDDRERLSQAQIARLLIYCDELDPAQELLDSLLEDARSQGTPLVAVRAFLGVKRGDVEASLADGELAVEGTEGRGLQLQLSIVYGSLAEALVMAGRPAEALELVERLEAFDDQRNMSSRTLLLHARGLARSATGDRAGAIDDLRAAGAALARWGVDCPGMLQWRTALAQELRLDGETSEAHRLAEEELALARAFGARRPLGVALRGLAACSDPEEATALLEEAVEVLADSAAELEHAAALAALGARLRRGGRRGEARERLLAALDLATRCASPPLEGQVREELAALGTRPRRHALSGPDSLTPSQARVASLAAEGLTNKEIAQTLFVTTKTVETHLSRTYEKLSVRSRAQLVAALADG